MDMGIVLPSGHITLCVEVLLLQALRELILSAIATEILLQMQAMT